MTVMTPTMTTMTLGEPRRSDDPAPSGHLANLLDGFTHAIGAPDDHTIDDFAQRLNALRAELMFLARNNEPGDARITDLEFCDLEFSEGPDAASETEATIHEGLEAEAELEHLCWSLSN